MLSEQDDTMYHFLILSLPAHTLVASAQLYHGQLNFC